MDSIDTFVNMNLIDMDCIHVVPNNRIPDESYIERLFPKCSPKQDNENNNNNNNDDSSPTKTPANNNNNKKHRRRRQLRARPKPKAPSVGISQTSNSLTIDNNGNMIASTINGGSLNGGLSNGLIASAQASAILHMIPQRSSRLQFNTLSDYDSGTEEQQQQQQHRNGIVSRAIVVEEQIINGADDELIKCNDVNSTPTNSNVTTATTTTTATTCKVIPSSASMGSMFPRLDEGLSSDALSSDEDDNNNLDRRNEENLFEADDEDDEERVANCKRSHKHSANGNNGKHDNHSTTKVPTKSATRSSGLNRLAREASVKGSIRPSSDTDIETDRLLGTERQQRFNKSSNRVNGENSIAVDSFGLDPENCIPSSSQQANARATNGFSTNGKSNLNGHSNLLSHSSSNGHSNSNFREVLIEGVLFNVKYLGSTHSNCEGGNEKIDRINQAEMAVHEVKLRNGESNEGDDVQLFISTEKVMVLDAKKKKLLMDPLLKTISYIADIGQAVVLIVKTNTSRPSVYMNSPISRVSCHVFESEDAHSITNAINQAFQVAYAELLKGNNSTNGGSGGGSNDALVTSGNHPKEVDYQQVLNSQEMPMEELDMFAKRENQREIIVPKRVGEILGLSIVESGWGSVLPTVVIANIKQDGPADKCKKLSIGYQILSVNGVSLVGLPLADCQEILRRCKQLSVARLSVVPGPITVEVKIKRPDTKYQLGFSVQNGVICSLLRGGIAERGGVRVGHRIMSINGTTVVGAPHDKIVNMLANSVGEIRMITCLTSLYKLILGEEKPVFF